MKRKIGLFAALVALSTGLVAPTVEAGRASSSCSYVKNGDQISVDGTIDGIRWVTIYQPAPSGVTINYLNNTVFFLTTGVEWTQGGRASGTFSASGYAPDSPVESVIWYIYNARYQLKGEITCTTS